MAWGSFLCRVFWEKEIVPVMETATSGTAGNNFINLLTGLKLRFILRWESVKSGKRILKFACVQVGFVLKIWRKRNIKGGHVLCKNLYLASSGHILTGLISHPVTNNDSVIGRKESGQDRCRNVSTKRGERLQKLLIDAFATNLWSEQP